jgi:hypothetical protein
MADISDDAFGHISKMLSGIEDTISLHRVTPPAATVGSKEDKNAAAQQEDFDFNIANVLLYNYCQRFKV